VVGAFADYILALDVVETLWVGLGSITSSLGTTLRRRRGRPRKFATPSRAVTLTLPESVLTELEKIAPDPSHAIVQLMKRRAPTDGKAAAELVSFGRRAVISVKPTPTLNDQTGIELVPMPDGRALITFDQPTTLAELELTIYDALENANLSSDDRKVFEAIGNILKEARRSEDVSLLRRNIIVLESSGPARRRNPKTRKSA